MTTASKKYYEKNKDKFYAKSMSWKAANKEKVRSHNRAYAERDVPRHLLRKARERCRLSGVELTICKEDIIIPTHCPYLGIKLGSGDRWTKPSLDRIDPTKGYVKDNVEVISLKANTMKNNASASELRAFAKAVLRKLGDSPSTDEECH